MFRIHAQHLKPEEARVYGRGRDTNESVLQLQNSSLRG